MEKVAEEAPCESTAKANVRRLSAYRNIVAGGIGGMVACVVGHPLDTVKVRLQVMSSTGQSAPFTGSIDCLQKMVKAGGVTSLFRGMLSPLLIATPVTALSFYSLSIGKRLQLDDPTQEPTMIQYMLAGVFCGLTCSFVFCPAERLKCILQVRKTDSKGATRGPLQVLLEIYRKERIRGIYKGLPLTMLRDGIGNAAWYLTYEGLLKSMRSRDSTRDDVTMTSIMISGGVAGIVLWVIIFPLDNLKTRYQVAPDGAFPGGARQVAREVLQTEGLKALCRGYAPAVLRAPLVHIALFVGYELTLKALNVLHP